MFSSRVGCAFIDCDDLTVLDFWFEYVGSQSKYSQVESVVSSSIVMIGQFWISGSNMSGVKAYILKSNRLCLHRL